MSLSQSWFIISLQPCQLLEKVCWSICSIFPLFFNIHSFKYSSMLSKPTPGVSSDLYCNCHMQKHAHLIMVALFIKFSPWSILVSKRIHYKSEPIKNKTNKTKKSRFIKRKVHHLYNNKTTFSYNSC